MIDNQTMKINWYNDNLRKIRETLHFLRDLAKVNNSDEIKQLITSTRSLYKREIKKAKLLAMIIFLKILGISVNQLGIL